MGRTYQLQLTDFQSQATQIGTEVNITSIHTASGLDFDSSCTVASQFKSKLLFQRDAASLIAPDTIKANNYCNLLAMNLTYLNSMPANCRKESTSRKEVFYVSF
jgi:hypothetical protein